MATTGCSLPSKLTDRSTRMLPESPTVAENATLSAQRTKPTGTRFTRELWPTWARTLEDRLSKLLYLRPDWDSYGAQPIQAKAADQAVTLLLGVMNDRSPTPSVVPTSAGGVQLEWHVQEIDLEIEINPAGNVTAFSRDGRSGIEWEDLLPNALPRLRESISRLSE